MTILLFSCSMEKSRLWHCILILLLIIVAYHYSWPIVNSSAWQIRNSINKRLKKFSFLLDKKETHGICTNKKESKILRVIRLDLFLIVYNSINQQSKHIFFKKRSLLEGANRRYCMVFCLEPFGKHRKGDSCFFARISSFTGI